MTDFASKLSSLVSLEMAKETRSDPDKMAEVIEQLASSLAFTVAIAAKGEPKDISTMLEGVSNYIYETAAERAPLARMIATSTSRGV